MVVQHNLTAMNSNRMLGITTKTQAKATEKLSSGYKINRAADDAAGLSISEKMRKQIRGLTQASANAQDGISAVQTAEGALTEVHDMLQRMNELAVKAANGTNSKDDRDYIQAEVDQLVTEIDRVATTTKFNESYLLKGTNSDGTVGKLTFTEAGTKTSIGAANFDSDGIATVKQTANQGTTTATSGSTYKTDTVSVNGKTYTYISDFTQASGKTDKLEDYADSENRIFSNLDEMAKAIKKDSSGELKDVNVTVVDSKLNVKATAFSDLNKGLDVSLHVGADSTKDNKIGLTIEMMSAKGLGVNGIRVDGEDFENATASIDTIKAAIQKVSEQRSALGAVQNRLEHTINNLDNVVENTTSAESAIRDTDMASQMVTYSNNNILAQAGQAMLAQANQSNQGVLSLLG
ncbi:flagellin [Lachnospiraceae bacterium G11]|nr:flagellin [Lachnospiraceae bacterium G11]